MSAQLLGNKWVNIERKFLVLLIITIISQYIMNAIYVRIFTLQIQMTKQIMVFM